MAKRKRSQLQIVSDRPGRESDKRFFCRFMLKDFTIRFKDLRLGDKFGGVCKNISAGGMGVVANWNVQLKTPVEIWLDCQDGFEPFHIIGKVVWSVGTQDSCYMGIVFDRPRLMSMSRILKLEH
ncbi:MAG: PilZ domain-containing protein [Candidatus Omnitrophota bacterium]